MRRRVSLFVAGLFLIGFHAAWGRAQGMSHSAVATLKPTQGNMVKGTIRFNEAPPQVRIVGDITGLPPGKHGLHIHEKGDCSAPDASSAGGHFNPEKHMHGAPDAPEHHMGDLGNITADAKGKAHVNLTVTFLTIAEDPNTIAGKGLIVHAQEDDLKSQPVGNAGARLACGVIQKKN